MDSEAFDRLTRVLGSAGTRRSTLGTLIPAMHGDAAAIMDAVFSA
jgi:hypothetical protein